jgi:hypothetical protein
LEPVLAPNGIFDTRLKAQTEPIHWVAFMLDPTSHLRFIDPKGRESATKWILDQVQDKKEVRASLQDFRDRGNGFTTAHYSQMHIDNPIRFWKSYFDSEDHDELARLAVRIFETIANSAAFEGAFSAMNLIVTKLWNWLSAEKADKLIYIYMNQRVLDKAGDLLLGDWVEKSDEEQVRLEELLLSIDEEDDDIELDEDEDS